ncbi:MAG: PepSY domain-containing protein, partial [Acidobacteria bacterium]
MPFRTFWLKAHLYVGLTIGIVLCVVAVSGAALVFEDNIDRARHRALSYVTPGDHFLPLQDLTARVKAAYPSAQLGSISFPEKPDHSMQVSARTKQDALSIYINEYTGQVLGDRSAAEREASLARRIHLLHTRLFAGQIGEWIVGVITFMTLFMAITGLILWWPRKIFNVKGRASWRRINFDLHNVFGLYASAVFLFIALTGMMISFEQITDPLIARLNATPLPEVPKQSTVVPGAAPMSADALAERAKAALPGAFLKGISIPNGGKGVIVALMKYPEDRTPGGRSRVYLDQYSGDALAVLNTRTAPLGTRILNLKRSAH